MRKIRRTRIAAEGVSLLWLVLQQTNSEEAFARLVHHYDYLVRITAERIHRRLTPNQEREDLVQEGTVALIRAIKQFDPAREVKFESYAIALIRGAILESVRGEDFAPRSIRSKIKLIEQARKQIARRTGNRHYSDQELADEIGIPLDRLYQWLSEADRANITSTDNVIVDSGSGDVITVADTLATDLEAMDVSLLEHISSTNLMREVESLPEREKLVLQHYYWLGQTFKQIGAHLQVSESRIHQLHKQAVGRLNRRLNRDKATLTRPTWKVRVPTSLCVNVRTRVPAIGSTEEKRRSQMGHNGPARLPFGTFVTALLAAVALPQQDRKDLRNNALLKRHRPDPFVLRRDLTRLTNDGVLHGHSDGTHQLGGRDVVCIRPDDRENETDFLVDTSIFPEVRIPFETVLNLRASGSRLRDNISLPTTPSTPVTSGATTSATSPPPPAASSSGIGSRGVQENIVVVSPVRLGALLLMLLHLGEQPIRINQLEIAQRFGCAAHFLPANVGGLVDDQLLANPDKGVYGKGSVRRIKLGQGRTKDVHVSLIPALPDFVAQVGTVYDLDDLVGLLRQYLEKREAASDTATVQDQAATPTSSAAAPDLDTAKAADEATEEQAADTSDATTEALTSADQEVLADAAVTGQPTVTGAPVITVTSIEQLQASGDLLPWSSLFNGSHPVDAGDKTINEMIAERRQHDACLAALEEMIREARIATAAQIQDLQGLADRMNHPLPRPRLFGHS